MHDISIDLDTIVFYECLMPLSTISHYIVAVSFIDEGNQIIIGIHILSQFLDKLFHIKLYSVTLAIVGVGESNSNFSGDRHS